jgi:SAM-dependent methyltransferase
MTEQDLAWVDPTNAEQLRAWDTGEGVFWTEHAELFDRSVSRYDDRFLAAAEIRSGHTVLDVGCGTGATTRAAGRLAGSGSVLGLDLSSPMLALARRITEREGLTNVRFEQGDAQVHPFPDQAFDGVVSRTGAMFFGDPAVAFSNLARSLRPGGRLTLLVWQPPQRNEWFTEIVTALSAGRDLPAPPPDAPGPFSLGDPGRIRSLLTGAGFTDPRIEGLQEPMYFGSDAVEAHRFVAGLLGWMLEPLDAESRRRALADLRMSIEAHRTGEGVAYDSATWLVTADRG